jgi:hypothetical protein
MAILALMMLVKLNSHHIFAWSSCHALFCGSFDLIRLISVCAEISGEFSTQTVVNDGVSIQRAILIFGLDSPWHMRMLGF